MKKLRNTEAELKKSVAYKKSVYCVKLLHQKKEYFKNVIVNRTYNSNNNSKYNS